MNAPPNFHYREEYETRGYTLLRRVLPYAAFLSFQEALLKLCYQRTGRLFPSLHDTELLKFFNADRRAEAQIYDELRQMPEMKQFATSKSISKILHAVFPEKQFVALQKMILRMDLPKCESEVAHWHQDYFYVRGNTETVTLWIPMQDVDNINGCLLVQTGSHLSGRLDHPVTIGKRHCPAPHYLSNEKQIAVPMALGDVLCFHPLLLHSGQVNHSERIRFAFNLRYSPVGLPVDSGMGGSIPFPSG
jgi:ectoine hydroxylase-related dioxygenase (phytanoyl-CoA dioxygenase family)